MKAICDGLNLSIAVSNVSKAISGRTTSQILEGIKIKAEDDHLVLTATDTEIAIEQKIPAEVLIAGEIVVPGKYFLDFIRKLNNEQIELSFINNNCLKIKYNDSEGVLQCYKADEFPSFEKLTLGDTFSLIQKELKDLISKTVFCSATEDSRPILKGVLFEIDDYQVTAVALDGYRLAVVKKPLEQTSTKVNLIIPARSLVEISKLLNNDENPVTLYIEKNKLMVEIDNITIISRLIEGEFILYKNIIPKEFLNCVNFNKNQLEEGLERASVLSRGLKNNLVTFDIKEDSANIVSISEIGNIKEKIPVKLEGKEISISFNPKYIADALKVISCEHISLKLNTSTSPSILTPINSTDELYMILPIRTA